MRVSQTNILSALLRHHVRPGLSGHEKSAEINEILKELSDAPTVSDKHAIIERLLLHEERVQSAATVRADQEVEVAAAGEEAPPPVWRMSIKSTEVMNGLRTEQFSRQWEAEAIIRSIFEQHGQFSGEITGIATPFMPTAQDMAKAIGALGYSTQALYGDGAETFGHEDEYLSSEFLFRLLLVTSGVALIVLVLLV